MSFYGSVWESLARNGGTSHSDLLLESTESFHIRRNSQGKSPMDEVKPKTLIVRGEEKSPFAIFYFLIDWKLGLKRGGRFLLCQAINYKSSLESHNKLPYITPFHCSIRWDRNPLSMQHKKTLMAASSRVCLENTVKSQRQNLSGINALFFFEMGTLKKNVWSSIFGCFL